MLKVYSHIQHPEFEPLLNTFGKVWPEFIFHDPIADLYDRFTLTLFAHLNLYLCDEAGELRATGKGVPIVWDGTIANLPEGWDAALSQAVQAHQTQLPVDTFCALGAMVTQWQHGRGLSKYILRAMKLAAIEAGLTRMIAPVRPTLKSQYPLTPMERYIEWKRDDGSPFDPWLRVHWQEGAKILGVASRSMLIKGKVSEWEGWTGLRFLESGQYVVPDALSPITINYEADEGIYVEPNVWVQHDLQSLPSLELE
jgi:hypothetical protein